LIAELLAGEIGRAVGLPVPEIVFIELDPDLARTEPDPEIQDLIRASAGLNLALDYLPGSITFDPVVEKTESNLASSIVWFDAYITNVDRTPLNTNMLIWHRRLWLIDHGASLYFHHTWASYLDRSRTPFAAIKDHVLLPFANSLPEVAPILSERITPDLIHRIIELIPDAWLAGASPFSGIDQHRNAYAKYLLMRLEQSHVFLEEALHARSRYL
jgi:hypothetical protein